MVNLCSFGKYSMGKGRAQGVNWHMGGGEACETARELRLIAGQERDSAPRTYVGGPERGCAAEEERHGRYERHGGYAA
jgi:hypothetical protein